MALRALLALLVFGLLAETPPVDFVCPMDPEVRSAQPGKCPKCGMKLEAGIRDQMEYPLRLQVTPRQIPAGRELQLLFRIADPKTGKPVTKFEVVHEELFHLFIVSQDLQYFAHVHPERQPDGAFLLRTTLPKQGVYRLLADYYPTGGVPQLTPKAITTEGYTAALVPAVLKPDLSPQHGENLEAELTTDPPQPIAGKKTLLFFKLKPADGLEPYIGAWGHMLAVSDDLIDMIHTHPSIADGGPNVQFDLYFPREAAYRIWVQFQRLGKVNTLEFTVPVSRLK
jgi:heavy metal-binding protein